MFYFFLFIIGLAIGSFLTVVIDRLTHNQSIFGRSYCDFCHKTLASYDLFPLVSFLFYRGTARCCGKKISWHYPVIELTTGLLFVLTWRNIQAVGIYQLLYVGIISCLVVIFFADIQYQIIPDKILIVLALFVIPFLISSPVAHIIAAIVLFSVFQFIHTVTKGKAMGYGDVKFALVIGLFQGLKLGALSIYLSFLLGGFVGVGLVLLGRKKPKSAIAFGPFLVTGVLLTIFFEKELLSIISNYFYPLR